MECGVAGKKSGLAAGVARRPPCRASPPPTRSSRHCGGESNLSSPPSSRPSASSTCVGTTATAREQCLVVVWSLPSSRPSACSSRARSSSWRTSCARSSTSSAKGTWREGAATQRGRANRHRCLVHARRQAIRQAQGRAHAAPGDQRARGRRQGEQDARGARPAGEQAARGARPAVRKGPGPGTKGQPRSAAEPIVTGALHRRPRAPTQVQCTKPNLKLPTAPPQETTPPTSTRTPPATSRTVIRAARRSSASRRQRRGGQASRAQIGAHLLRRLRRGRKLR